MYLCFVFSENTKNISVGSATQIVGNRYVLNVLRSPDEGPWYPHIAENLTSDTYQFFAGRLTGVNPSDKLPQGHAVCDPKAENWEFDGDEPDGSWLGLKFDRRRDVVSIANDLFLMQRWYYTCQDGNWYFSNSLLFLYRVLQGKLDIEQRAVPYLLLSSYLPFDVTPLKDVYDLRTGRVLTIENGKSRLTVRAKIPIHRHEPIRSEDAPQIILSTLRDAVGRELQNVDSVILPLSGGIDSRFLLGIALEFLSPEQITTLTFGHPHSLDFTIGTRLSKKLGVKHIALPMDERPLEQILDQNFLNAEGMYWVYPEFPVEPYSRALPMNTYLLSGYIGETVFGLYFNPRDVEGAVPQEEGEHLLALIQKTILVTSLKEVRSLLQLDTWDPLGFEAEVLQLSGADLKEKYDRWRYENHKVKRNNFCILMSRDRAFYLTPFVHRKILDVAYALTDADRDNHRAYFSALKDTFPDLYAYPTKSNFGFPLDTPKNAQFFAARALRKVCSRFDEIVGAPMGKILYDHPRNNYSHPRELFRKIHRRNMLQCFEELKSLDVFNSARLDLLRDRYLHNKPVSESLLWGLLTVHRWMKFYGG